MSRFVRSSKYRHVYGDKSKVVYENAKVSGSAWDTNLVTASGKYIAVNWQVSGGGAFAVLPSFSSANPPAQAGLPTKLPDLLPLARGHTAPVLDTAWSPFNDNLVVSAGDDGKIFIWNVEDSLFDGWSEDGWTPKDLEPSAKLNASPRKVGQVEFNPAASHLLASASGDHVVRLWDIEKGQDEAAITLTGFEDSIQSIAWNPAGTLLAATCRDRKIRIFDPRAGTQPIRQGDGHAGIKGSRVVWVGEDRLASTGFSRQSERQLNLWDTDLKIKSSDNLDSSAGVIIPHFVEGNNILFLAGKGDGNIRYYEYVEDGFQFISAHQTSEPQRGIGFIPRRSLDVSQHEIARAFKLTTGSNRIGMIEPLSFRVPRKAEGFLADIYPPANSIEPALTAAEWLGGKTARPKLFDLGTGVTSANKTPVASTPAAATPAASSPAAASPAPTPKEEKPAPKEEPKPTPKAEPAPSSVATKEPEPEVQAKSLEIEQPDEPSEDEAPAPVKAPAPAAATKQSNGSAVKPPTNELLIKLLSPSATLPTRGSPLAAGLDLYAAEAITLPARGRDLVSTQIAIAVPAGTYGRIAPRSGLAAKHGINVGAGVVDADYRGEVKVVLFNHNDTGFKINAGDRVAQLILEKFHDAPFRAVESLDDTERGAGGFGSTDGFRP